MENGTIIPEVGMGATIYLYSDCHACTIVKVSSSRKTFTIQRDEAKRIDTNGMSESQDYEYFNNPNGESYTVRKTKKGWKCKIGYVGIGHRREYYDFSF